MLLEVTHCNTVGADRLTGDIQNVVVKQEREEVGRGEEIIAAGMRECERREA